MPTEHDRSAWAVRLRQAVDAPWDEMFTADAGLLAEALPPSARPPGRPTPDLAAAPAVPLALLIVPALTGGIGTTGAGSFGIGSFGTGSFGTGSVGTSSVGTNGDAALNGPAARGTYNVTGAGIKIGILSDSFNAGGSSTAQITQQESNGDLPASVTVLADFTGNDEGRAMAELVHQVAPGAQIYFATAYNTEQMFANDILSLAAAGCRIIVDDVIYFEEPFFGQPNVISQAISTVIGEGVSYFTAAGNFSTNYYEAAVALIAGTLPGVGSAQLEDFGTTAAANSGSNTLQNLTISSGATVYIDLQWNQPFFSLNGTGTGSGAGSAYSLALYLYDSDKTTIAASATFDTTTDDPLQFLTYVNTGGTGTYYLAIALNGGTITSGTLKYVIASPNSATPVTINDSNAGTGSGTTFGHQNLAAANTVAAAPASSPGTAEAFSSTGNIDFTAPDGIATSVSTASHSFATFYGTSAAAPNAAAVGALLLQANPNLTPAEVSIALTATATAMPGGASKVGAGFVNAEAAVAVATGDLWIHPAGGSWTSAADWAQGTPGATTYATLSDNLGALTASYGVSIAGSVAAGTLTVGNATSIAVGLTVPAGATLAVGGGATVGQRGSLIVAGQASIGGALQGAGTVSVAAAATLTVAGSLSAVGILLAGGSRLTLSASVATLNSDRSSVIGLTGSPAFTGSPAQIDLQTVSSSATLLSYSSGTLAIRVNFFTTLDLQFNTAQNFSLASFTKSNDGTGHLLLGVACYLRGTRIATPAGETPIELLRIGDPVLTAAGAVRPIRWIGRRTHAATATAADRSIRPIRIRAGALPGGLPRRDLLVSPEHALLLRDGDRDLLVPAALLENGASIARLPGGAEAAYFHLELKAHDAIRAEGQPAETFVDDHSRAMFDNAADYPHPASAQPALFCAPRIAPGPELARLRQAIDAQAGLTPGPLLGHLDIATPDQLAGWALDPDHPDAPALLDLLVDGQVVATTLANRHRADLAEVTGTDGHCGFLFIPPPGLATTRRQIVAIRRATDATPLGGALRLLDFTPQPTGLDRALATAADPVPRLAFLTARIAGLQEQKTAV